MGNIARTEIDKAIDAGEDDGYPADAARDELAALVAEVDSLRTQLKGAVADANLLRRTLVAVCGSDKEAVRAVARELERAEATTTGGQ